MRRIFRFFLLACLSLCYAFSIAPDLTWAHFSADGGDLSAAAAVNGVPHPAGYPLYLIFAKIFQIIPIGSLAFRTNLLSAVCTVVAAVYLFELIYEVLDIHREWIAMAGALAYGLAPAVWGQALVTEVYALHGLFTILCMYVYVKQNIPEWQRGLIFGLSAANHLTSVFIFPLLLFYGNTKSILARAAGVAAGLLLYFTIPLRASFNPPINWGGAQTLGGFWWLISGAPYQGYVSLSLADFILRLRGVAGFTLEQFTILGVFFGVYGLLFAEKSRLWIFTLWASLCVVIFSAFYGSYDSHVYLIVLWACFAVWISIGAQESIRGIQERVPRFAPIFSSALILFFLLRIPFTFPKVDISSDTQASEFMVNTLRTLPNRALVFMDGDAEIFTMWYAQYAVHQREDIILVAEGLLPFDWYLHNLSVTYSGKINIPAADSSIQPFDLIVANPSLPVCYLHKSEELDCIK